MKLIIHLACVLLLGGYASGAVSPSPDVLDQKKIHNEYNDGNFDKVTASLEGFMARNKTFSLEDSIFIAKHLAVVYSANPQSREKGKYYMYRLLAMLPSAKLIDMYVSDEIDRIFDKVREEFLSRQKSFGVDTATVSIPEKSPSSKEREPIAQTKTDDGARTKSKDGAGMKRAYLVGGTAVVALGVAAIFLLNEDSKTTEKTYVVP